MIGPLPDTPKTYVDATLGHLESALDFGRMLAEKVAALEAENERLRRLLERISAVTDGYYDAGGVIDATVDAIDDLLVQALFPEADAAAEAVKRAAKG